jgi:hypothetical protein
MLMEQYTVDGRSEPCWRDAERPSSTVVLKVALGVQAGSIVLTMTQFLSPLGRSKVKPRRS